MKKKLTEKLSSKNYHYKKNEKNFFTQVFMEKNQLNF